SRDSSDIFNEQHKAYIEPIETGIASLLNIVAPDHLVLSGGLESLLNEGYLSTEKIQINSLVARVRELKIRAETSESTLIKGAGFDAMQRLFAQPLELMDDFITQNVASD